MTSARHDRGFTLVELMIAVVILTMGLLGLASGTATMTRYQAQSSARAEMTLLADSKVEQLRAAATVLTPDTVQLQIGGSVTTPTALHTDTLVGPSGRVYVRLWSVQAGPSATRDLRLRIQPEVVVPQTPARLDFAALIVPLLP